MTAAVSSLFRLSTGRRQHYSTVILLVVGWCTEVLPELRACRKNHCCSFFALSVAGHPGFRKDFGINDRDLYVQGAIACTLIAFHDAHFFGVRPSPLAIAKILLEPGPVV